MTDKINPNHYKKGGIEASKQSKPPRWARLESKPSALLT
jgi:hypothetical protein